MSDKRAGTHTLFVVSATCVSKFRIYVVSYNRFTRAKKSYTRILNSRVEISRHKYLALNMRVGILLFQKLLPQLVFPMIYRSICILPAYFLSNGTRWSIFFSLLISVHFSFFCNAVCPQCLYILFRVMVTVRLHLHTLNLARSSRRFRLLEIPRCNVQTFETIPENSISIYGYWLHSDRAFVARNCRILALHLFLQEMRVSYIR